jgi:Xaa-Pro aminopeptidase
MHSAEAFLSLALLLSLPGAFGARAAGQSLERSGSGAQVCGLGKDFHAGRRAELARRLKEAGGDAFVLRGLPAPRDYRPFSQDKMFWYLTGIESPDAALVIDLKSGAETLFLPGASPIYETWNGERWDVGDKWVADLAGFKDIRGQKDLLSALDDLVDEKGVVWTSLQPNVVLTGAFDSASGYDEAQENDPLDGRTSREKALQAHLKEKLGAEVKDASPVLNAMRWVKEPAEVDAIRRASQAGALAIAEAMRSTRPGLGEWDLASLMSFVQTRAGARGPAYGAIVGSGPNSCSLHYLAAARRMQAGEPLLVDYGPEVDHYVTDITRTWPVSGRFEGRLKELYEAVAAAQQAGIAAVKPGASLADVDGAARAVLQERGVAALLNHGVCHSVGLEVHDPGPRGGKLEPGGVFTVEPGAYDTQLGIGIRIEDVVVCTQDGGEVLTSAVPTTIEEIEALMKQQGILDEID